MCIGGGGKAPKIPDPQPLQQPAQLPETPIKKRKDAIAGPKGIVPGDTMLTGAGGVPTASLNTGGNTLLGG